MRRLHCARDYFSFEKGCDFAAVMIHLPLRFLLQCGVKWPNWLLPVEFPCGFLLYISHQARMGIVPMSCFWMFDLVILFDMIANESTKAVIVSGRFINSHRQLFFKRSFALTWSRFPFRSWSNGSLGFRACKDQFSLLRLQISEIPSHALGIVNFVGFGLEFSLHYCAARGESSLKIVFCSRATLRLHWCKSGDAQREERLFRLSGIRIPPKRPLPPSHTVFRGDLASWALYQAIGISISLSP